MTKFNLVIAFLAIISAIGNIFVGKFYAPELYSNLDLILAIVQIFVSIFLFSCSLAKLKILEHEKLANFYKPAWISFWFYAFTVMFVFKAIR